jgi:transposase
VSHAEGVTHLQMKRSPMKQVIAIDLAKRVFQIHIPTSGNRPALNKVLTRNKLLAFIANQPESIIVI